MTGHLDDRDRARMSRNGLSRCRRRTDSRFRCGAGQGRPFVIGQLDHAALRSHSAIAGLPPMFRGLIRIARRTAESAAPAEYLPISDSGSRR
jgi:hypothetical protein